MDKPHRPPYLQLVVPPPEPEKLAAPPRGGEQLSLFRAPGSSFIGIVNMTKISANQFVVLLENTRPMWLIDFRPMPRFDIGRLDRRGAFDLFRKYCIDYRDVTGLLGIHSRRDASFRSGAAAAEVAKIIAEGGSKTKRGPMLVLVDDDDLAQSSALILPRQLRPRPKGGWDTRILNPR
jgi:hypothetical protein